MDNKNQKQKQSKSQPAISRNPEKQFRTPSGEINPDYTAEEKERFAQQTQQSTSRTQPVTSREDISSQQAQLRQQSVEETTREQSPTPPPPPKRMFGLKKIIAIILILVLLGAGAFFLLNQTTPNDTDTVPVSPEEQETPTPTPTEETLDTSGWSIFSEGILWQIEHPEEITPQLFPANEALGPSGVGNAVVFVQWGETQLEGTELYDGLQMTIGTVSKPAGTSLRNFADEQTSVDDGVSQRDYFRETTIETVEGYEAQVTGLGTFTHIFLPHPETNDRAIRISYIAEDPEGDEFEQIAHTMLSTFRFIRQ